MSRVVRRLLEFCGYEIIYVSNWGIHTHRYGAADARMHRPLWDMRVAPPWAKRRIVKIERTAK